MKPIALVTGASKGIGAAIALALAHNGYNLWLNYHNSVDAAQAVAAEAQAAGAKCTLMRFDVSDNQAVEEALAPHLAQSTPYAIINNAGFAKDGVMALMSPKDWNDVLGVHLNGFYNVTHAVLPAMMKKRKGRIVNISSVSGQLGSPGQVNYSAAKAGLIGATRSLAVEIGRRNITANVVAPGFIDTEMLNGLPQDIILKMVPLGRIGKPSEVAEAVLFLCSDKASYITGQVLGISGGFHI